MCCPACNYTFYFCSESRSITDYTNRVYVCGAGCQNYFKKQCSSLSLSQTKTLSVPNVALLPTVVYCQPYTTHCGIVLPLCLCNKAAGLRSPRVTHHCFTQNCKLIFGHNRSFFSPNSPPADNSFRRFQAQLGTQNYAYKTGLTF